MPRASTWRRAELRGEESYLWNTIKTATLEAILSFVFKELENQYLNVRQKEKEKPGRSSERDYLSASRERKQGETQTNTAPLLYMLPARAGLAEAGRAMYT